MNSKNSKTSDPHRLLLNLPDKTNLKRSDKYVALSNLSNYYTWKNIKISYKNYKFKISVAIRNEEFELLDGSYSVSDIQDYFTYILKKHETVSDTFVPNKSFGQLLDISPENFIFLNFFKLRIVIY